MRTEEALIAVEARADALEIRVAELGHELEGASAAITLLLNAIACGVPITRPDGVTVRIETREAAR